MEEKLNKLLDLYNKDKPKFVRETRALIESRDFEGAIKKPLNHPDFNRPVSDLFEFAKCREGIKNIISSEFSYRERDTSERGKEINKTKIGSEMTIQSEGKYQTIIPNNVVGKSVINFIADDLILAEYKKRKVQIESEGKVLDPKIDIDLVVKYHDILRKIDVLEGNVKETPKFNELRNCIEHNGPIVLSENGSYEDQFSSKRNQDETIMNFFKEKVFQNSEGNEIDGSICESVSGSASQHYLGSE